MRTSSPKLRWLERSVARELIAGKQVDGHRSAAADRDRPSSDQDVGSRYLRASFASPVREF